ncbi:hypothetical protein YC2023_009254 [Brassica napus]
MGEATVVLVVLAHGLGDRGAGLPRPCAGRPWTNLFEEGGNDRTQIEHRPVQIMDTTQGVISRPTQQVKTDGRARIHFGRAGRSVTS